MPPAGKKNIARLDGKTNTPNAPQSGKTALTTPTTARHVADPRARSCSACDCSRRAVSSDSGCATTMARSTPRGPNIGKWLRARVCSVGCWGGRTQTGVGGWRTRLAVVFMGVARNVEAGKQGAMAGRKEKTRSGR